MFDKEQFSKNDKGVSPVIGVILMVAITVILAAVIGTFVLDLAGNVEQSPQAAVSFSDNPSAEEVDATVISMQNADDIELIANHSGATVLTKYPTNVNVGDTATVKHSYGDPAGTISVKAYINGNSAVVQTYSYDFTSS